MIRPRKSVANHSTMKEMPQFNITKTDTFKRGLKFRFLSSQFRTLHRGILKGARFKDGALVCEIVRK